MYRVLQAVKDLTSTAATQHLPQNLAVYTVTVGKKRGSSADYYLPHQRVKLLLVFSSCVPRHLIVLLSFQDVERMLHEIVEGDSSR